MKVVVTVVLENGEVLNLKAKERDSLLLLLDNGYTLTGRFNLYKMKGNVLCGEEVMYKSLDVHIEK